MKEAIKKIIEQAEAEKNYSLLEYVKQIIDIFATTVNCPTNWISIGEELEEEYRDKDWIYDGLQLWDYAR